MRWSGNGEKGNKWTKISSIMDGKRTGLVCVQALWWRIHERANKQVATVVRKRLTRVNGNKLMTSRCGEGNTEVSPIVRVFW